MQRVKIKDIRIDGGTQPRVAIDNKLVKEYAEAMRDGDRFPAMKVVFDGAHYWLYDGFHRYHAAILNEVTEPNVEVTTGSQETARWLSVTTNKSHGLRRSNEDKQKAVRIALEMKPDISDRAIAMHCGVSHNFVGTIRKQLSSDDSSTQKTVKREGLDGRVRTLPMPPAPEEPQRPVDKLGRYIPEECMEVWNRRAEIQEHLTALSKIRTAFAKGIENKDPIYKGANPTTVKASLGRAYGSMKTAMPYVVCPMCHGHGSCRACEDKGMISQYLWETVIPRETKEDIANIIEEQD